MSPSLGKEKTYLVFRISYLARRISGFVSRISYLVFREASFVKGEGLPPARSPLATCGDDGLAVGSESFSRRMSSTFRLQFSISRDTKYEIRDTVFLRGTSH